MSNMHPREPLFEALRRALAAGRDTARSLQPSLSVYNKEHFYPVDGPQHVGDPQHFVDAAVLDAIENSLRETFPRVRVIGEESIRSVLPKNYLVVIVDPVDGTKPYTHLGEAWAVVGIMYHAGPDRLEIPAAGILTASGTLVGIWNEQTTTVEIVDLPESHSTVLDCGISHEPDRLAIACVGAKAKDRRGFIDLASAFPEATIFNTGGNPVVWGVLNGDLDAIVSFEPQTSWDSAYALAVILAGGTVGATAERRIFSKEDVLAWFRTIRQGTVKEVKHVPALIVAKDETAYSHIFNGLRALKVAV